MGSGLSCGIVRPTVVFGPDDILINNSAWFLRTFPIFAIPGDGQYRLQPVYVEDVAELAVRVGHDTANVTLDAVGPEIYTFDALVNLIADAVQVFQRLGSAHLDGPGDQLVLPGEAPGHRAADEDDLQRIEPLAASGPSQCLLGWFLCCLP
ncbi:MAG: hypothetical protein HY725_01980 [Candidatus Rokubacteria bacterium]|nr:hypothetical protein [Candidatus Rokubacteria bacterium]